ncbi:class I SAM-dependent methyltransferase [Bacillus sp. BHET2]|uniref:class I SAM-dependent methyltransferase n=1 Tax=Bacillus sp. BHET2 TaxID=2583818 RepID=UPI001486DE92|nr:class I SAM-dependent methyltransferase [Bacillus sp. BHET2]
MTDIQNQYKNASNLQTRITIHELYSENKQDWHEWLFEQYKITPNSRILEIGCGDGSFWFKNKDRVPSTWHITLSDFSPGMLHSAKERLKELDSIHYLQFNIEEIPFEDNSMDVIIANHMLYHVPDRKKGVGEIRRVLKPGGVFYASTIGENHMKEFGELVNEFDQSLNFDSALEHARQFGVENGEKQLRSFFDQIVYKDFPGDLHITDEKAVADYILSSNTDVGRSLGDERLIEFLHFLKTKKDSNNGFIKISKSTGLFTST